ncbi:hypothetical protein KJQ78_09045 [Campylobacter lari]|uniref:hypothetical protein n=1 Tax=Campylobacter lari TaxID=201 RepID=UPI00126ECE9D|nr:hypothetical protein [Campylobacter lari]MBT0825391.1 hypothetical protein [Campylobacter lari]
MSVATNGSLSFNNSQINNLSFGNLEINNLSFGNLEINNLSFGNLEINNLYGLIESLKNVKESAAKKIKEITQAIIEIYLELYKKYLLYNIIDNIYHFTCDKKQEKTIVYEQKIEFIYNSYLDKFKKNIEINETEKKLLSNYRNRIDRIKNNIPRAKKDSLNFFYSVYALNELLNFYFDDYLELAKFLTFPQNIAEFGKNIYIRKQKLI